MPFNVWPLTKNIIQRDFKKKRCMLYRHNAAICMDWNLFFVIIHCIFPAKCWKRGCVISFAIFQSRLRSILEYSLGLKLNSLRRRQRHYTVLLVIHSYFSTNNCHNDFLLQSVPIPRHFQIRAMSAHLVTLKT